MTSDALVLSRPPPHAYRRVRSPSDVQVRQGYPVRQAFWLSQCSHSVPVPENLGNWEYLGILQNIGVIRRCLPSSPSIPNSLGVPARARSSLGVGNSLIRPPHGPESTSRISAGSRMRLRGGPAVPWRGRARSCCARLGRRPGEWCSRHRPQRIARDSR